MELYVLEFSVDNGVTYRPLTDEPFLLRQPDGSIKKFGEYGNLVNIPYSKDRIQSQIDYRKQLPYWKGVKWQIGLYTKTGVN